MQTNPYQIIKNKAAAARLGISPSTYWRLVREGELPRPIKIGKQASGQPEHVLIDFVVRRQQAS